jgi:hypothetical protein
MMVLMIAGKAERREHLVFGHVDWGFSASFMLKRLAVASVAWVVPFALSVAARQGILGLFAMVVAFWPYRCQFLAEARGLRVSWWFLKEWLSWDQIQSAEVIADPRAFVLGRRKPILRLERRAGGPAIIRSDEASLEWLARRIHSELAQQRH